MTTPFEIIGEPDTTPVWSDVIDKSCLKSIKLNMYKCKDYTSYLTQFSDDEIHHILLVNINSVAWNQIDWTIFPHLKTLALTLDYYYQDVPLIIPHVEFLYIGVVFDIETLFYYCGDIELQCNHRLKRLVMSNISMLDEFMNLADDVILLACDIWSTKNKYRPGIHLEQSKDDWYERWTSDGHSPDFTSYSESYPDVEQYFL